MQPYFLPYLGYFQLINAVDLFVSFDDVSYRKKGWINRNVLNVNSTKYMFTVPLVDASQNKMICDLSIQDNQVWLGKLKKTVKESFSKSPYFEEGFELLQCIGDCPDTNLASYVGNSIKKISTALSIKTEIVSSASLQKSTETGADRIIEICKIFNADTYINPINGISLYEKDLFAKHGIDLRFLQMRLDTFQEGLDPYMSILEALLRLGKMGCKKHLLDYDLY